MAAKGMYDYLSSATPGYDAFLGVEPQEVLPEISEKDQTILEGDGREKIIISHSDDSIFYLTLRWRYLEDTDAGVIFDFFNDSNKANGMVRSFKLAHPTDGHNYVIRFVEPKITRLINSGRGTFAYEFLEIKAQVIGYV